MSQLPPQPPVGEQPAPYGSRPPYAAAAPRRKRPRPLWFFIGGALLVIAPLTFAGALFTVLRPLTQEDAVFAADDSPVRLDLTAGEERALFTVSGASANCSAVDGSGEAVEFRPVTGNFTVNEWTAVSRFDTGDGELTVTCDGLNRDSRLRVAQLPSTGGFIAGIVIGIVAPLALGGIGLLMLIVTAALYATGAPREEPDLVPEQAPTA